MRKKKKRSKGNGWNMIFETFFFFYIFCLKDMLSPILNRNNIIIERERKIKQKCIAFNFSISVIKKKDFLIICLCLLVLV